MPETPHSIYEEMADDQLAEDLLRCKEEIAGLRGAVAHIEFELQRRLEARNARILQGEQFRVTTNIKRTIAWDQDKLAVAYAVAGAEGHQLMFQRAFPLERKANLTHLNSLLKYGGKTAEAIELAKTKEDARVEYKVTEVPR
jgi:hypothetical protein